MQIFGPAVLHFFELRFAFGSPILGSVKRKLNKISTNRDGYALFRPGDLLSGESRKLFITLRIPTNGEQAWTIGPVSVHYRFDDQPCSTSMPEPLRVACVADAGKALASIDKAAWEEKVVREDYNLLREEVAAAVKEGKRDEAMNRIDAYRARQQSVNASIGSEVVSGNLEKDVGELCRTVTDSFTVFLDHPGHSSCLRR